MTEYDNTNSFVLFVNDKGDNDKRPDRTGTLNVDGIEYFMDGWIKQGAKGPFLSGKIKPKDAAKVARTAPTTLTQPGKDFDDDVPFN
jgi:hypothetical protein